MRLKLQQPMLSVFSRTMSKLCLQAVLTYDRVLHELFLTTSCLIQAPLFIVTALPTTPHCPSQVQAYGAAAVDTSTPTLPGQPFSYVITYTCQTVAMKVAVPATRLVWVVCANGALEHLELSEHWQGTPAVAALLSFRVPAS